MIENFFIDLKIKHFLNFSIKYIKSKQVQTTVISLFDKQNFTLFWR